MATASELRPAFREFTVIMHDEVHAVQAFAELEDENNPLHSIKDGMGINYGVGGMGRLVGRAATAARTGGEGLPGVPRRGVLPQLVGQWRSGACAELTTDGKPVGATYPDDPSNVHHSYLGDPVRFRNLHAGPKETHVFHLHAHQWVQ